MFWTDVISIFNSIKASEYQLAIYYMNKQLIKPENRFFLLAPSSFRRIVGAKQVINFINMSLDVVYTSYLNQRFSGN